MSDLQQEVLAHRINRKARTGVLIRAHISVDAFKTLQVIRMQAFRTYADIYAVVVSLLQQKPELFDGPVIPLECTREINFRLAKRWSTMAKDRAWEQGVSRVKYLGHATDCFLALYSPSTILEFFSKQLDRVERIKRRLS